MDYQALYRTHRPQRFGEVVGQGHVTTTLSREVVDGKVAHAYLFAGPRGTGKTTTARILAKALNCPNRSAEGEPCDDCQSCRSIAVGNSFDVIELDAASHNSVDDVRDLTVSVATVASVGGASRVFILDEAHMLSKAAANALLKTLEEPPPHVHFVLATTEPYRLLDTIRSRTQRFDFHPVSLEALVDHLVAVAAEEGFTADRDSLLAVARHAKGSVRDSLSLLEQVAALGDGTVEVAGVRRALGLADAEQFPRLARAIEANDAGAILALLTDLDASGVDLRRFVSDAIGFFRGVFLAGWSTNLEELVDEPAEVLADWRTAAAELPPATVLRAIDGLGEGLVKIREGREERLMVELTLLKLARPELDTDVEALVDRVARLERAVTREGPRDSGRESPSETTRSRDSGRGSQDEDPEAPFESPIPTEDARSEPPVPSSDQRRTTNDERPPPTDERPPTDEPGPATDPEPATDERPPATDQRPATDLTLEAVQGVWPQVFGSMRQALGPRRQALFREALPGAVHDGILELWVPEHLAFHLEQLRSDDEVQRLVADRVADLLGGRPVVRFEARPGGEVAAAPSAEVADDEPLPDKNALAEAPDEDATDLLAELGGEVIEDVTYDR